MRVLIFSLLAFAATTFGQDLPPPGLTPKQRLEWIRRHPPKRSPPQSQKQPPQSQRPPPESQRSPPQSQRPSPPTPAPVRAEPTPPAPPPVQVESAPQVPPPVQAEPTIPTIQILPEQTVPSLPTPPMPSPPQLLLSGPITMYVRPPTAQGKSATVFSSVGFNYLTCPRDNRCERIDWIDRDEPVQVYGTACGDLKNPGTSFSCESAMGERYFQVRIKDEDGKLVTGYIQASYLTLEKPKGQKPPELPEPEPPKQEPKTEAQVPECKDCQPKTRPIDRRAEEMARRLKEEAEKKARHEREEAAKRARERARHASPGSVGPGPVPDMGDTQKINERCQSFINEDGRLGPWGEALKQATEDVGIDCFMTAAKWRPICPKFDTFNADKKMQLLAFAFAARAQHESSCDETEEAKGIITEDTHYHPGAPTKIKTVGKGKKKKQYTVYLVQQYAVGLFQLEKSAHRREDMKRGPFCETNNPKDIKFQMECSLATMKRVMCEWGGTYTSEDGYWQQELSPKRKISKMISRFPGCK